MKELDPLHDLARELGEQADLPVRRGAGGHNPVGGSANVGPNDTLGYLGGCWCGEPCDHTWPGSDEGAPHPRGRT